MKNSTFTVVVTSVTLLSIMFVFSMNPNLIYAEDQKFKANLGSDNEIPPVTSAADGKVKIKVKDDVITSEINVTGIKGVTGAHIYSGNKSENGEAIVDLLKSGETSNTGGRTLIQGQISPSDFEGTMSGKTLSDLQSAMATGGTYINILTPDHPDGELRGQIKLSGSNATKIESMDSNITAEAQEK